MTTETTECCKSSPSTECCQSADSAECCQSCPQTNLGLIYGAWLLRAWLAVRAIQTGVEKFAGMKGSDQPILIDGKVNEYGMTSATNIKEYALSHYHGVPEALMKKFTDEPLMLKWALPLYDKVLGPALIILGLTILLGIASRTSYFLLGLLYVSLTWGLVLIKEDSGVAWLGIHMIMIVMALWLSKYNRLCVLKKW
jgi:thiosulfate dehydrogenase [quinone] large subunit